MQLLRHVASNFTWTTFVSWLPWTVSTLEAFIAVLFIPMHGSAA